MLEQRTVSEDHQRWLSKLLGYDFDIQYQSRKDNSVADALSRKTSEVQLYNMDMTWDFKWADLQKDLDSSSKIHESKKKVEEQQSSSNYTIRRGRLLFSGRIL